MSPFIFCLNFIASMITDLLAFDLPWTNLTFGMVVIGVFSLPLFAKMFRRFF